LYSAPQILEMDKAASIHPIEDSFRIEVKRDVVVESKSQIHPIVLHFVHANHEKPADPNEIVQERKPKQIERTTTA